MTLKHSAEGKLCPAENTLPEAVDTRFQMRLFDGEKLRTDTFVKWGKGSDWVNRSILNEQRGEISGNISSSAVICALLLLHNYIRGHVNSQICFL